MKRKLFTLLLAFVALANFSAFALLPQATFWVHSGDSVNATGTRAVYPASPTEPAKLVYVPGTTATNGTWKYVAEAPGFAANDKIVVSNPDAGVISFKSGSQTLSLASTAGVSYTQFVPFTALSLSGTIVPHVGTPAGTPTTLDGSFGYLAVQASGTADEGNLLIVVHNAAGALSLKTYTEYTNSTTRLYPVYIRLEAASGRWATAADFADDEYRYFSLNGSSNGKIVAYSAEKTASLNGITPVATTGKDDQAYSVFKATQVDYIPWTGNSTYTGSNSMISAYTANQTLGTQNVSGDYIIPLFTLGTPEDSCKVLSVSRINNLKQQNQFAGSSANKLEIRTYGSYYTYVQSTSGSNISYTYTKQTNLATGIYNYQSVTSLQKFAIWINDDGTYTLYPAASYSWKYGYDKWEGRPSAAPTSGQATDIVANDVFKTNNKIAGGGVKIGYWSGHISTGAASGDVPGYIGTIPAEVQTYTDYTVVQYTQGSETRLNKLGKNRFYFLEVLPDTTGLLYGNNYQEGRQYVLATDIDPATGYKRLVALPKEKVRQYKNQTKSYSYKELEDIKNAKTGLADYWSSNPYDSVNMAAHWELIEQDKGGYIIVNELKDTLQFNVASPQLTNPVVSNIVVGGYLTQSEDIAGTIPGHNWFAANPVPSYHAASSKVTFNVWKSFQLKPNAKFNDRDQDDFFLELENIYPDVKLGLTEWGAWYQGNHRANRDSLNSAGTYTGGHLSDAVYWQKNVNLVVTGDNSNINSYATTDIPSCKGLIIKLAPIYYVPEYADSYTGEPDNGVINTNDKNFDNLSVKQDSLSAYLYLNSIYDISEATAVQNKLFLDYRINEYGINVAQLMAPVEANRLQFIPLEIASTRKTQLSDASELGNVDDVFGETYKWSIVKLGNQYLVFDTIAPTATDNRLKVGFTFQNTIEANATPVRLYQPLVGDKLVGNFLFQFYLPKYTYYKSTAGAITKVINELPDIEATSLASTLTGAQLDEVLVFGQLSNQSNYILANVDKAKATRFTYNYKDGYNFCQEVFIAPDWLAANKLLGLPLSNTIWERAELPNAAAIGINTVGEAIVSTSTKPASTELKFQYVGKIAQRTAVTLPGYLTSANVVNNDGTLTGTAADTIFAPGNTVAFVGDLDVPLYFVRNSDGKYLTVSTTTDQYNTSATVPDVTGVKLIWADLYPRYKTGDKYDKRALQTFAISGCNGDAVKCDIDNADEWGKFIFLPLASYKINYGATNATDAVLTDEIFYNVELGAGVPSQNDVTKAFRVGQYVKTGGDVQNLVVVNASASSLTSNVAIEFKVSKKNYDKLDCHHYLAYDNRTGSNKGYIKFNGARLANANDNTIIAHWRPIQDAKDDVLYSFSPELADATDGVYGTKISKTATGKYEWNQLTGSYYFKNLGADGAGIKYHVYDFSSFSATTSSWQVGEYDLTLTCTEHALPFLDLEEYFNIDTQKLAILEDAYADRNLTYKVTLDATTPHYLANNGTTAIPGFEAFIAKLGEQYNVEAEYLTVYRENRRLLTDVKKGEKGEVTQHLIPYYSFSLTAGANEYFLNVFQNAGKDSVAWTVLTDAEKTKLINYIDNPDYLPKYKFCLPYRVDENGEKVAEVAFGEAGIKYPPVYLQTLDTKPNGGIIDYPYLVVAGASTKYVTAVRLNDAMLDFVSTTNAGNLEWNIYSVDYSKINRLKVTGWIFGGPVPVGNEWVPLLGDAGVAATVDGILTDYKLGGGGATFITESKETPVNYGVITGLKNAEALHFVFEGDTTIGDWALRPIWYYKIQIPGEEKYLTDAVNASSIAKYPFGSASYDLGYFTTRKANVATMEAEGITADDKFDQTFGFKYVTDKSLISGKDAQAADVQAFYVVSHADYRGTAPKEVHYRYLAEVNNHLVFVDKKSDALIFQFGKKNAAGDYTGIEVVGQSGIYGVNGGVKILGGTGKVDLYTIDGRLIKSTVISGADQTITAPKGVVIVKNGSKVAKVVVK
ncbi:hypothetical protein FACS189415_6100 [Bacteroidia bacterium]|nr:hypothetical protein FACS189415_6100 [Bacteroidia bacterium]